MATYEAVTPEEEALLAQALADGEQLPAGYAYNPGWYPVKFKRVVDGGGETVYGPVDTLLDARIDALETFQTAADARYAPASAGVETEVSDAVLEWWIHPLATYLNDPPRTVFGAIASDGAVLACEYNHGTGQTKRYPVGQAIVDDHCAPALWVESGHRPVIAWTNHNADGYTHVKAGSRSGDLGSLVTADDNTVYISSGNLASYTQLHRITDLSTDTLDTYWCFTRRTDEEWIIQRFEVDQETGIVTFGTRTLLVGPPSGGVYTQAYLTTADAHVSGGNQVIRCAWGFNPANSPRHDIFYFEIDCVTGAITSPADAALAANLDGTNLPLTPDGVAPAVADVASGSRRLFYARPGPDTPAVAHADWATTADAATYYVTEISGQERALVPGTGSAQAAYAASMDTSGFEYTAIVKTPASVPATSLELGRRYLSSGNGWYFRLTTAKTIHAYFGASGGLSTTSRPARCRSPGATPLACGS